MGFGLMSRVPTRNSQSISKLNSPLYLGAGEDRLAVRSCPCWPSSAYAAAFAEASAAHRSLGGGWGSHGCEAVDECGAGVLRSPAVATVLWRVPLKVSKEPLLQSREAPLWGS